MNLLEDIKEDIKTDIKFRLEHAERDRMGLKKGISPDYINGYIAGIAVTEDIVSDIIDSKQQRYQERYMDLQKSIETALGNIQVSHEQIWKAGEFDDRDGFQYWLNCLKESANFLQTHLCKGKEVQPIILDLGIIYLEKGGKTN